MLLLVTGQEETVNPYDAVRHAAAVSGVSTNSIGRSLGKADSYVSSGASRGSIPRADVLASMLGVCGWSLAAMPSDDVPESAVVIDPKPSATSPVQE